MREFALDLIRKSARHASARLQFARIAFGAAGSAGEEELHLALEALLAVVRGAPAVAAAAEPALSDAVLTLWMAHANDPLLSADAADLLQARPARQGAQNTPASPCGTRPAFPRTQALVVCPDVAEPLFARALPPLAQMLRAPDGDASMVEVRQLSEAAPPLHSRRRLPSALGRTSRAANARAVGPGSGGCDDSQGWRHSRAAGARAALLACLPPGAYQQRHGRAPVGDGGAHTGVASRRHLRCSDHGAGPRPTQLLRTLVRGAGDSATLAAWGVDGAGGGDAVRAAMDAAARLLDTRLEARAPARRRPRPLATQDNGATHVYSSSSDGFATSAASRRTVRRCSSARCCA